MFKFSLQVLLKQSSTLCSFTKKISRGKWMRHLHHTLVKHTESDTSWKMWQQWGKGRDRGQGCSTQLGHSCARPAAGAPWLMNTGVRTGTQGNWLCKEAPTGSESDEPQMHFFPADTLNWLVHWLGGSWSPDEIPSSWTYTPTERPRFRHWHTWVFYDLLAVGQNSQLRVSRVPVTPPQQQQHWHSGPYGHGQADFPSFWNGWAVSTRSLPSGVSFSTSAEFQGAVENIYRQDKEQTTRLRTLQYSFRQGTLWYHNQLILLWHQVFST